MPLGDHAICVKLVWHAPPPGQTKATCPGYQITRKHKPKHNTTQPHKRARAEPQTRSHVPQAYTHHRDTHTAHTTHTRGHTHTHKHTRTRTATSQPQQSTLRARNTRHTTRCATSMKDKARCRLSRFKAHLIITIVISVRVRGHGHWSRWLCKCHRSWEKEWNCHYDITVLLV